MNHHVFSTVSVYYRENQTILWHHQVRNNNTISVLKLIYESEAVVTAEVCPFNVLINEPSRDLHKFSVLSQEPDNMVEPSGEKQQHMT